MPDEEQDNAMSTAVSDSVHLSVSPMEDSATHHSDAGYADEELLCVISKAVDELDLEFPYGTRVQ